jgi:DNA-binding MarR family transcriptional regulator
MPHQMASNSTTNDPLIIFLLVIVIFFLILLFVFVSIFLSRYFKFQNKQSENIRISLHEKPLLDNISDKSNMENFTRPSQWEILSLEEQAVVDLLIQNKGNLLQKDVPIKTNFSKSTVSRILSRLEDQDIVYRSPAGRGYRIFLRELETL